MVEGKKFFQKFGNATTIANSFLERQLTVNQRVQMILNKRKLLTEEERLFLLKYAGDSES